MKEDQSIDRGLEIMKFFALLMFLYSIVAFMRPWPYPLKAGLSLLKSAVRIDTPVFLYIILGAFLLFSVVFNLLAMFSLFMDHLRFTHTVGRIGQACWAVDIVLCICRSGSAAPARTVGEIVLDILCICLTSAAIRLRREKAEENARQEKPEPPENAETVNRHDKGLAILFVILISIQFLGAFFLYVFFGRGGELMHDPENSIISGRYKNWHRVQLDEAHMLRLPEDWILVEDGDSLYIEDSTGRTAAFGKRFESPPTTKEYCAFLSDHFSKTVSRAYPAEGEPCQYLNSVGIEWTVETIAFEDGQTQKLLLVSMDFDLFDASSEEFCYYLCFEQPDEELYTIATAMIYSVDK